MIDTIIVKIWCGVRNTVTTINTSVSIVAKQQEGANSFLNTIRGEIVDLSESQQEYTIKIRMRRYEILMLIIYEVIILIAVFLVVRLIMHVCRLCNFNNFQIQDSYVKQNVVQLRFWEIKVMSF